MDVDLTALGLPGLPARVLACVAEESWTTSVALAGRLGVSRSQVSAALDVLTERGLVQRTTGQRPAPVRLAAGLDETLTATLSQQAERRRVESRMAEAAAEHLRRAHEVASSRPAPMTSLDPLGPAQEVRLVGALRTYDEVCRADGPTMLFGQPLVGRRLIERRILVLGEPPADRRRWMERKQIPLRTTEAPLPMLLVVDRCRARVELSAEGRASRTGWTTDAAQVAAALRLFDLWWEEAGG